MKRPNYFSAKDVDEKWEEHENIVRMWRAVLDQVLQDLVYEGKGKEDKKAHLAAWEWLNETDEGSKYRRKLERSLEDIKRAKRERIRRQTN